MQADKLSLLEAQLRQTFEDMRLSKLEKRALQDLVDTCSEDERRFLHNRAFDIFREELNGNSSSNTLQLAYSWLEHSIKALQAESTSSPQPYASFSPGEECRNTILRLIDEAKHNIDICVFTISDNILSEAIVKSHLNGRHIRILTDNEKTHDRGSDIQYLGEQGIEIREDSSSDHMHHKFAVFDKSILLNGSFNWTRSATERNYENVAVNYHPTLVNAYQLKFDELWEEFRRK